MTKEEKAIQNFKSGMNCSQAVFLAFADDFGVDMKTAKMMTLGLGGGVGRMREVCGAVTGAAMVLGVAFGDGGADKASAYEKIQEFARRFQRESGSIICADRLGLPREFSASVPQERNEEYYKRRPCAQICGDAARIVEKMLADAEIL